MTCDEAMNAYFLLDSGEAPPADLAAHLAACPACAVETRRFGSSLAVLRLAGDLSPDTDLSRAVMEKISALDAETGRLGLHGAARETRPELSLGNWIGTGLLIVAGMLLIPFSTILPALHRFAGPGLELYLHLVMGAVVTTYITLFIGSHLTSLRRMLRMR